METKSVFVTQQAWLSFSFVVIISFCLGGSIWKVQQVVGTDLSVTSFSLKVELTAPSSGVCLKLHPQRPCDGFLWLCNKCSTFMCYFWASFESLSPSLVPLLLGWWSLCLMKTLACSFWPAWWDLSYCRYYLYMPKVLMCSCTTSLRYMCWQLYLKGQHLLMQHMFHPSADNNVDVTTDELCVSSLMLCSAHRETRWSIALKCRPLSRSSLKVRAGHLFSVWSDYHGLPPCFSLALSLF